MTQDTNPILTEDDIQIFERGTIAFPKKYKIAAIRAYGITTTASFESTKEDAELMVKQILTALEEYPKLKESSEFRQKNYEVLVDEYAKITAENKELKKNLPDMTKWTIGAIIKELEEHPEYTAKEILQRHRDLYRDSPSSKYLEELEESNQAHIEACGQWNEKCYKLQQENESLRQLKQRVEQLDLSFLIQMMWSNFSIQKLEIYSQIADQLQQLLKDDIK